MKLKIIESKKLTIKLFDKLFEELYHQWEDVWIRPKDMVNTEFYNIRENKEIWWNLYKDNNYTFFLVLVEGKFVGMAILIQENINTYYIEEILVDSKNRGKGIGSFILDEIKKKYKKFNLKLNLYKGNRAEKLYKAKGFKLYNKISKDRENGMDTLQMILKTKNGN